MGAIVYFLVKSKAMWLHQKFSMWPTSKKAAHIQRMWPSRRRKLNPIGCIRHSPCGGLIASILNGKELLCDKIPTPKPRNYIQCPSVSPWSPCWLQTQPRPCEPLICCDCISTQVARRSHFVLSVWMLNWILLNEFCSFDCPHFYPRERRDGGVCRGRGGGHSCYDVLPLVVMVEWTWMTLLHTINESSPATGSQYKAIQAWGCLACMMMMVRGSTL